MLIMIKVKLVSLRASVGCDHNCASSTRNTGTRIGAHAIRLGETERAGLQTGTEADSHPVNIGMIGLLAGTSFTNLWASENALWKADRSAILNA